MKIGNFGSFDENLKKQGIVGLTNASKLDKEIYDEFSNNWDKLAYESEFLIAKISGDRITDNEIIPEGKQYTASINARVNQEFFRKVVLTSYESTCCITGINIPQLLVASHIKPWRDSDSKEKTDPRNGLCLNSLHDKAFDQGLITILPNYRILLSHRLKDEHSSEIIDKYFKVYEYSHIMLPEKFIPNCTYLEFHNDVIYQG